MSLFDIFRRTPDQIARDYTVPTPEELGITRAKYDTLLQRAVRAQMDPGTILLLLQFFGPLVEALVKAILARIEARKGPGSPTLP